MYILYMPLYYMLCKVVWFTIRDEYSFAKNFWNGYFAAKRQGIKTKLDQPSIRYFRWRPFWNVYENFVVMKYLFKLRVLSE